MLRPHKGEKYFKSKGMQEYWSVDTHVEYFKNTGIQEYRSIDTPVFMYSCSSAYLYPSISMFLYIPGVLGEVTGDQMALCYQTTR